MTTPSAYEIADAWAEMEAAVNSYCRRGANGPDTHLEWTFETFARLIQRVPKEPDNG